MLSTNFDGLDDFNFRFKDVKVSANFSQARCVASIKYEQFRLLWQVKRIFMYVFTDREWIKCPTKPYWDENRKKRKKL